MATLKSTWPYRPHQGRAIYDPTAGPITALHSTIGHGASGTIYRVCGEYGGRSGIAARYKITEIERVDGGNPGYHIYYTRPGGTDPVSDRDFFADHYMTRVDQEPAPSSRQPRRRRRAGEAVSAGV